MSERVNRYAIIISGNSGGDPQEKWYRAASRKLLKLLTETYNYPREAIYYLFEHAEEEGVDGQSNWENLVTLIRFLQDRLKPEDHLFIMMIGHGRFHKDHSWYKMVGPELQDEEFGRMLNAIPSQNITMVMSPCNMGYFIKYAAKEGRVITSATRHDETNKAAYAEPFIDALIGRNSILDAHNYAIRMVQDWYRARDLDPITEHALIDDTGEGTGHHLPDGDGGQGALAGKTFLGDQGKPLQFSKKALKELEKEREQLQLRENIPPSRRLTFLKRFFV